MSLQVVDEEFLWKVAGDSADAGNVPLRGSRQVAYP